MKTNCESRFVGVYTVYLNGKKLAKCLEADEEEGYAWIPSSAAEGDMQQVSLDRDFIYQGLPVSQVKGDVRIEINLSSLRTILDGDFVPLKISEEARA